MAGLQYDCINLRASNLSCIVRSSVKRERFLGNNELLHSMKFRFTFIHVYIHALINLKIKPSMFLFGFTTTYYIIRTFKLKPKLTTLKSIRFSFYWSKNLEIWGQFHLFLYLNKHILQEKWEKWTQSREKSLILQAEYAERASNNVM